jgi:hypothetical protein
MYVCVLYCPRAFTAFKTKQLEKLSKSLRVQNTFKYTQEDEAGRHGFQAGCMSKRHANEYFKWQVYVVLTVKQEREGERSHLYLKKQDHG